MDFWVVKISLLENKVLTILKNVQITFLDVRN